MNIFLIIVALIIALMLSLIITRVATLALMLTGLSRETARFQARSAFTGVGFTTSEAESVTNHPVRRHIVMTLMLLGNVGIATVIASIVIAFVEIMRSDGGMDWMIGLVSLAIGLTLLWYVSTSPLVERRLNMVIGRALKRFTNLDVRDYVSLLKLADGYTVSELHVDADDWVAEKTLVELGLASEGVLVLGIRRSDGHYVGSPSGTTRIVAGDALVIYGPLDRLQELDTRCYGSPGDAAHEEASKVYDSYRAQVEEEETVVSE